MKLASDAADQMYLDLGAETDDGSNHDGPQSRWASSEEEGSKVTKLRPSAHTIKGIGNSRETIILSGIMLPQFHLVIASNSIVFSPRVDVMTI